MTFVSKVFENIQSPRLLSLTSFEEGGGGRFTFESIENIILESICAADCHY